MSEMKKSIVEMGEEHANEYIKKLKDSKLSPSAIPVKSINAYYRMEAILCKEKGNVSDGFMKAKKQREYEILNADDDNRNFVVRKLHLSNICPEYLL